jgi:nitrogen regulatory protein P-II 2
MHTVTVKLVTIVAEGLLRDRIIDDLLKLGAKGYTIGEVHGHGSSGISEQFWDGPQLRIETLVTSDVADRILQHLQQHYFENFSVIAYVVDATVVRADKYR